MPLQGSLREFGIIELLQFPHNRKRTCQLLVVSKKGGAQLYYDKGKLVHAEFRGKVGAEVVTEVVGWDDGSFEMKEGVGVPNRTVEEDLHKLILLAIKTRDERKVWGQQEGGEGVDGELTAKLEEYIRTSGFALHLSLLDSSGRAIAQASDPEKKPEGIEGLQKLIFEVLRGYPRKGLKRITYEDELGLAVAVRLENSRALLVIAGADRSLGAVSLGVNKLAGQLGGKA